MCAFRVYRRPHDATRLKKMKRSMLSLSMSKTHTVNGWWAMQTWSPIGKNKKTHNSNRSHGGRWWRKSPRPIERRPMAHGVCASWWRGRSPCVARRRRSGLPPPTVVMELRPPGKARWRRSRGRGDRACGPKLPLHSRHHNGAWRGGMDVVPP